MEATARLFEWCLIPDVGDQEVYLAGTAAILDQYPRVVQQQISDPRTGTRYLGDRPTLSQIRKACDELFAPIERQAEREIHRMLPEPKRPPRSPEQQAKIDAQIEEWKRISAGIPR
jgi:hypothetical protein